MHRSTKVMTRSRRIDDVRQLSSKVLQMLALDIESFLPEFSRIFASLTKETRLASEHVPWKSATCFAPTSVFQVPQHFISAKGLVVLLTSAVPYQIILGPQEHVKLAPIPNINFPVIESITTACTHPVTIEFGSVKCYAQALIDITIPWFLDVPSDSFFFVRPQTFQPDDTDSDTDSEYEPPPSALHSVLLSPHLKGINIIGSYFALWQQSRALCCAVQRFGIGVLRPITTPYRESGFYHLPELERDQCHAILPKILLTGQLKLYRPPICVLHNMPPMPTLHTCVLDDPELFQVDEYFQILQDFIRKSPLLRSCTIRTNFTMFYPLCDFIEHLLTRHGVVGLTVYVVNQDFVQVFASS